MTKKVTLGLLSFLPVLSIPPVLWFLFGISTGEWLAEAERSMRWFVAAGTGVTIGFLTGLGLAWYSYASRVFTPTMRQFSRLLAFVMFAPIMASVFWYRSMWREEPAREKSA